MSAGGRARGSGSTSVRNCELLAELPGYRSSISRLAHVPSFGIHRVGTIVLYGLKGVTGETVSATTLMAPSSATKAYRKGLKALYIENPNYKLSIKHLERAVAEYSDYAAAWASLAEARMSSGDWAGAREAFLKSIEADPKYLKPYEPFISASFDRRDWTTVDSLGEIYLKLHPEASQIRAMSAEAAVRLEKYERASELTQIMADRDESRRWPISYVVAGLVHESRSEFKQAAALFREYLNHDSESVTARRLLRTLYVATAAGHRPAGEWRHPGLRSASDRIGQRSVTLGHPRESQPLLVRRYRVRACQTSDSGSRIRRRDAPSTLQENLAEFLPCPADRFAPIGKTSLGRTPAIPYLRDMHLRFVVLSKRQSPCCKG